MLLRCHLGLSPIYSMGREIAFASNLSHTGIFKSLGPWIDDAWTSKDFAGVFKEFPNPSPLPGIPRNLSELFPILLPPETEDCLFLDFHVPKEILDMIGNGIGSPIF